MLEYKFLMYLHLATILPCVVIGAVLLILKKGTQIHKYLGRIYMLLMLITSIITLWMPARVGHTLFNHFGWIHCFSIITIYTIPEAYFAIRKGNIKKHKNAMICLYFGAIIIAGAFTFYPGRYLHTLFFGH